MSEMLAKTANAPSEKIRLGALRFRFNSRLETESSRPVGGPVDGNMLQNLAGNEVFQLYPGRRFVGTFGHRREGPVEQFGGINDHDGCLARMIHRRIDQTAAYDLADDGNLPVRLHPRRRRPKGDGKGDGGRC